jgi:hypothetical protein
MRRKHKTKGWNKEQADTRTASMTRTASKTRIAGAPTRASHHAIAGASLSGALMGP